MAIKFRKSDLTSPGQSKEMIYLDANICLEIVAKCFAALI